MEKMPDDLIFWEFLNPPEDNICAKFSYPLTQNDVFDVFTENSIYNKDLEGFKYSIVSIDLSNKNVDRYSAIVGDTSKFTMNQGMGGYVGMMIKEGLLENHTRDTLFGVFERLYLDETGKFFDVMANLMKTHGAT